MLKATMGYLVFGFIFLSILVTSNDAKAQALYPHTYGFACHGKNGSGAELSMVGNIKFSNAVSAVGGAEFVNGSLIQFSTFTATVTNGTAQATGSGGNGIPNGCFTGKALFGGDTFGVLNDFFGCYTETIHSFDLTQTSSNLGSGAALTCHGEEM